MPVTAAAASGLDARLRAAVFNRVGVSGALIPAATVHSTAGLEGSPHLTADNDALLSACD